MAREPRVVIIPESQRNLVIKYVSDETFDRVKKRLTMPHLHQVMELSVAGVDNLMVAESLLKEGK